jgi:hypothetical protein
VTPLRLSQGKPQLQDLIVAGEQYAARENLAGPRSVAVTVATDKGVGSPVVSLDPRSKRGVARAKVMNERLEKKNAHITPSFGIHSGGTLVVVSRGKMDGWVSDINAERAS